MENINMLQKQEITDKISKMRDSLFRAMADCRLRDVKLIIDAMAIYHDSLHDNAETLLIINTLYKEQMGFTHLFDELSEIHNETCDEDIES